MDGRRERNEGRKIERKKKGRKEEWKEDKKKEKERERWRGKRKKVPGTFTSSTKAYEYVERPVLSVSPFLSSFSAIIQLKSDLD